MKTRLPFCALVFAAAHLWGAVPDWNKTPESDGPFAEIAYLKHK